MSIEEKPNNDFDINHMPCVLAILFDKVLLNKNASNLNKEATLEYLEEPINLVETKKLEAENRDSIFNIKVICKTSFKSREQFDDMCLKKLKANAFSDKYDRIGIDEIIDLFEVDLSCNMGYYKDKADELVKDLNRKLNQEDLNDTSKLKQELFHKLMRKLIGNECKSVFDDISTMAIKSSEDWNRYTLENFCFYATTNFYFATAQNENFFILFTYDF